MASDLMEIAFVIPTSGTSGIYGPSCKASGRLAVSEINAAGGILGREVGLVAVDGGRAPHSVAAEVGALVETGRVQAVAGWHNSAVRQAVAARVAGRVPYVYTAVYEGGEHSPGVYLTGETPGYQLLPAMHWMARELGVRRWAVVGNDYVWPRTSARAARRFAHIVGAEIVHEEFVPMGTEEYGPMLRRVERARVQGVLMFLLGSDAVRFNRSFTQMLLPERCLRLSPLMDENMLLATGAANAHELYSAAGFFEALGTQYSLDFESRYIEQMGPTAPAITSPGESCFEGLTLLARLTTTARSVEVAAINAVADSVAYEGPRGSVRVRNRHLEQRIYLARADGLEFDVLAEIHSGG